MSKGEKLNWKPLRSVVSSKVSIDKLKGRRVTPQVSAKTGGRVIIP